MLFAQTNQIVQGIVLDELDRAVPAATVVLITDNLRYGTLTDDAGYFSFSELLNSSSTLQITAIGYRDTVLTSLNGTMTVRLSLLAGLLNETVVEATRADRTTPSTFSIVTRTELQSRNLGQDLPVLLQYQPAVVTTSDAGNGIGYTGLRIRGSDATRINYTLNGLPMNESDAHGVYWVNLPDFASSVQNIQIQRGVGTSTNGAGAFGASVNILTHGYEPKAFGELTVSGGSFNTARATARFGTGLIAKGWTVEGRLSRVYSDGYIDRAFADLRAAAVSAAHYGQKGTFRFNVFTGREQTYQAWNGVPEDSLATNRRFNPFTYSNQTDNYQQDRYQAFYTYALKPNTTLNVAGFYTRGLGYFEEFQSQDALANYGLPPAIVGFDTVSNSDIIRQKWLLNDFYGATASLEIVPAKGWKNYTGIGYNHFGGNYFGNVIWAQYPGGQLPDRRYYNDDFAKTDYNAFSRVTGPIAGRLNGSIDLQVRHLRFDFLGIANDFSSVPSQVNYTFFNPKAGLAYLINPTAEAYAGFAVAQREPIRDDFVKNIQATIPRQEVLYNGEAGYRYHSRKRVFNANLYYMHYRDQLVLTGRVNDVGEYFRENVPSSYRAGMELDAGISLLERFTLNANLAVSRNRIARYTEFADVYDANFIYLGNSAVATYENTPIAFSPNVVAGGQLTYALKKTGAQVTLLQKYVSRQFLDNTGSDLRSIAPYFVSDIRLAYTFPAKLLVKSGMQSVAFTMLINNVFNNLYVNNGYTYRFTVDNALQQANAFYPQAAINALAGLQVRF